jgi:hypothetical protein
MTLSDLSARLRGLSQQLQREDRYDPTLHAIAVRTATGSIETGGAILEQRIYPVLLEARNRGAFDAPHLADFKRRVDATADAASCAWPTIVGMIDELEQRGFDCWGIDPDRGAIERMADAFEAVAKSVAGEPLTLSRPPDRRLVLQPFPDHARELLHRIGDRLMLFDPGADRKLPVDDLSARAEALHDYILEHGQACYTASRFLDLPTDPTPVLHALKYGDRPEDGINDALERAFHTVRALIFDAVAMQSAVNGSGTPATAQLMAAEADMPDPVSIAVVMKAKNPNLSLRKIAKAAGIHYSTLSKNPTWQKCNARLVNSGKATIRKGSKSADGRIEAIDD